MKTQTHGTRASISFADMFRTKCYILAITVFSACSFAQAGVFITGPLTSNADSGLSGTKTYTHLIDFAGSGADVNGAQFIAGALTGANWTLTGNGASVSIANNVTGSLTNIVYNAYYDSTGAATTLTLAGLVAGNQYETVFYSVGYGNGGRIVDVSASDGGFLDNFDQDGMGSGNGNVIKYTFTAPVGDFSYTFSGGFLNYGFSNEAVVPEPGTVALVIMGCTAVYFLKRRRPTTLRG